MELLAPGGSIEGMKGAISAGADAIYMGGMRFGARAYADNPDPAALLNAIDYCHLRGRRLYLTVNTLVRPDEFAALYEDMVPVYEHGVDAVLVQDFGVLSFLKREFPDLPLHASTQMSVMSADGAALQKKLGAVRIVPARELSLEEIRLINQQVDIEIECFVHGALCYSYSGQCLMSSMIGGRSGNRGRCAQPCRLPWTLEGEGREDPYLLSLKDIQTLSLLPKMQDAGIVSLKIEGRMKQPEYAAGVTAVYRKYLDMLSENGEEGYTVDPEDERILMDLYNRGGFSKGYYMMPGGKAMLSGKRPNHAGTAAIKVNKGPRGRLRLTAMEPLHSSDVIEILPAAGTLRGEKADKKRLEMVLQEPYQTGASIPAGMAQRYAGSLREGQVLHRTRCEQLMERIRASYLDKPCRCAVDAVFCAEEGAPISLTLICDRPEKLQVSVSGQAAQAAQRQATTKEEVRKQLCKLGDTPFAMRHMQIEMQDTLFIRISDLNALRRDAAQKLEKAILERYCRRLPDGAQKLGEDLFASAGTENRTTKSGTATFLSACAEHAQQAMALSKLEDLQEIAVDVSTIQPEVLCDLTKQLHACGKRVILMLPPVWRDQTKHFFEKQVAAAAQHCDGFLLRCMDQIGVFSERFPDKTIIADAGLYTWNKEAKQMLHALGADRLTIPLEENAAQLRMRGTDGDDLIVYGYLPVMYSAQCVVRNTSGCTHVPSSRYITDRYGTRFPVENRCSICTNIIYNSVPLDLTPCLREIKDMQAGTWRLFFTGESPEECVRIARKAAGMLRGSISAGTETEETALCDQSTRGHFKRGAQ